MKIKLFVGTSPRCNFFFGLAEGQQWIKMGNQKVDECIDACVEEKLNDSSINGVAMHFDTTKEGCWCVKHMTGLKGGKGYKSCYLLSTGNYIDDICVYVQERFTPSGFFHLCQIIWHLLTISILVLLFLQYVVRIIM